MNNYEAMMETLLDMEKVAKALSVPAFPIYFLGGSACILGKYYDRATRDFDLIDLNYPFKYGKVLRYLNDFDMLEYESTILAPSYKDRAEKLKPFTYMQLFVLSREDIIVSKIIRLADKDLEDIDKLIQESDKVLIGKIIDEVLERKDLFDSKREAFIRNLVVFRERYDV